MWFFPLLLEMRKREHEGEKVACGIAPIVFIGRLHHIALPSIRWMASRSMREYMAGTLSIFDRCYVGPPSSNTAVMVLIL